MTAVQSSRAEASVPAHGRFRSAWRRLVASRDTLAAQDEQQESGRHGGTCVADLELRRPATVSGVLRCVTLRPRAGVPALEADVYDGTGSLTVIWLGRRQIAGVEVGRRIVVHGIITQVSGAPAVYNPRYELVARGHR